MKLFLKTNVLLLLLSFVAVQLKAQSSSSFYWGYCDAVVGTQYSGASKARGAIYIPADVAQLYKGASITGLRVGMAKRGDNVKIFVTSNLDGVPATQSSFNTVYAGWNVLSFSQPYEITGDPFYVGFSYDGGSGSLAVSNNYSPNGCWVDEGEGWHNLALGADPKNALSIQMKVSGTNLPKDLSLTRADNVIAGVNQPVNLTGAVTNYSPYVVRKYQIAYTVDGGPETIVDKKVVIGANGVNEFSIPINSFAATGTHEIAYRIASVDAKSDPFPANDTATAVVRVVSRLPLKRMVVEEGTGTWCGYCPRGIVGMRYMEEKYPHTFVGIAVHKSDALETASYAPLAFGGYPNCMVDRDNTLVFDPNSQSLQSAYDRLTAVLPEAGIEIAAKFADNDKTKIEATATTTFLFPQTSANYRLAFVLMESGVKGYQQANYFSGGKVVMGGFENLPSEVYIDMNHVARDIVNYEGIENSVPSSFEADQELNYTQTLDIPYSVQDANNLSVAVLLLNGRTGKVVNAAKTKVGSSSTASISVKAQEAPRLFVAGGKVCAAGGAAVLQVYTVDGVLVANSSLSKGVYVVRGVNNGLPFTTRIAW